MGTSWGALPLFEKRGILISHSAVAISKRRKSFVDDKSYSLTYFGKEVGRRCVCSTDIPIASVALHDLTQQEPVQLSESNNSLDTLESPCVALDGGDEPIDKKVPFCSDAAGPLTCCNEESDNTVSTIESNSYENVRSLELMKRNVSEMHSKVLKRLHESRHAKKLRETVRSKESCKLHNKRSFKTTKQKQSIATFDENTNVTIIPSHSPNLVPAATTKDKLYEKGGYEIELIMLLDNRELQSGSNKHQIKEGLMRNGIPVEIRQLPIGDISWICRIRAYSQITPGEEYDQRVLQWIVERKTLSDLSASILDGRYDEQKYRLLRSPGVQNVIYLIEANQSDGFDAVRQYSTIKRLPNATIQSAQINTQFITGFSILWTQSISHTISVLTRMHKQTHQALIRLSNAEEEVKEIEKSRKVYNWLLQNRPNWEVWKALTKKSTASTVQEVFGKQLRTITSCGPEATEVILSLWPTPGRFTEILNQIRSDAALANYIKKKWLVLRGKHLDTLGNYKSPVHVQLLSKCRELYAPHTLPIQENGPSAQ